MKKILLITFAVLMLLGIVSGCNSDNVKKEKQNKSAIKMSNLANEGYVCEDDNNIYFVDKNYLNKMDKKTKEITTIREGYYHYGMKYLNLSEGYLYFIDEPKEFSEQGYGHPRNAIYRVTPDMKETKELVVSTKSGIEQMYVTENSIIYSEIGQHETPMHREYCIYSVAKESGIATQILKKEVYGEVVSDYNFYVYDGWIYYNDPTDSFKLYRIKEDGTGNEKVLDVEFFFTKEQQFFFIGKYYINNGTLYYFDEKQYTWYRIDLDGKNHKKLFEEFPTAPNDYIKDLIVYDNKIIYCHNEAIYMTGTDEFNPEKLVGGQGIQNLNISDDLVFYVAYEETSNVEDFGLASHTMYVALPKE